MKFLFKYTFHLQYLLVFPLFSPVVSKTPSIEFMIILCQ